MNFFNQVVEGYVECSLWVNEHQLPDEGIDVEAYKKAIMPSVESFLHSVDEEDIDLYLIKYNGHQMGHDLYLTSNGHGAGFWDRGLESLGERLTEASKAVGSDSEIYAYFSEDTING